MKQIILKICILVVPVVLLASILFLGMNLAYKQTNHWKAAYDNAERFNHVPDGIQLCNVGTSHLCWGLRWEDYPELHAFNFSNASQPYATDLIILKHFESKIEDGAIVIIPIENLQIFDVVTNAIYPDPYYKFLTKKEFPLNLDGSSLWNIRGYLKKITFPLLNNITNVKYIFNDIPEKKIDRFLSMPWWTEWLTDENLIKASSQKYAVTFTQVNIPALQTNFYLICQIVDFCYMHNWKPVFITVPVYKYFYDEYSEMVSYNKKCLYQLINDLIQKYPDIPYWDFFNYEELSDNIELFMDISHLNLYGAEKFTTLIIDKLRENGYLE